MPKDFEETGVLDHLDKLSSAEDIFTYLILPFDAQVVQVSRLHIMKRFGTYLREARFDGLTQEEIYLACRTLLKQAYGDFVESTPLQEKVFKVFRDEEEKRRNAFVGIDALNVGTPG